jgi:hypothetical protein
MSIERRKQIEDRILYILTKWSEDGAPEFDGMWHGYEELRDQMHEFGGDRVTMRELKSAMRRLRELAMVRYATCLNFDYKPWGSGYFITEKGLDTHDLLMKSFCGSCGKLKSEHGTSPEICPTEFAHYESEAQP